MKNIKIYGGLAVLCSLLVFSFINCAEVDFKDNFGDESVASLSSEEPVDGGERTPTAQEEVDVLDSLTPKERIDPIPVREDDIDPDSELLDPYRCHEDRKIMICHFPKNLKAISLCVGQPAVAHLDHIRTYEESGAMMQIGDYYGPCRSID